MVLRPTNPYISLIAAKEKYMPLEFHGGKYIILRDIDYTLVEELNYAAPRTAIFVPDITVSLVLGVAGFCERKISPRRLENCRLDFFNNCAGYIDLASPYLILSMYNKV